MPSPPAREKVREKPLPSRCELASAGPSALSVPREDQDLQGPSRTTPAQPSGVFMRVAEDPAMFRGLAWTSCARFFTIRTSSKEIFFEDAFSCEDHRSWHLCSAS
jgi:hypothetical protein